MTKEWFAACCGDDVKRGRGGQLQNLLAQLPELMTLTNAACAAAREAGVAGPVNWADLRCIDALVVISVHAPEVPGLAVIISEAAPDAWELQTYVREYLARHGLTGVEVWTEW